MAFRPISRRTALKGLGVTIALPFLEAMVPSARAAATAAKTAPPRRMVFVYFPNGAKMDFWKTPSADGFELGPTLEALQPYKSNMLVFENLADANAKGGGAHACT